MSRSGSAPGPGQILARIISAHQITRSALEVATGLSRPTVGDRLRVLAAANLIEESSERVASGGRPATLIKLNPTAAVLLCLDLGETSTRVAVADLNAEILAEEVCDLAFPCRPEEALDHLSEVGRRLLSEPRFATLPLGAVSVSLPARVDTSTGAPAGWSLLTGWEGFSVTQYFEKSLGVPAFVDNDVNLLMLAERHHAWGDVPHLFYIKVGSGVGGALVVNGQISRGRHGAAGDIGHVYVPGFGEPICRCGNPSCLEAVAGGWALARDLQGRRGSEAQPISQQEVISLIKDGDVDAVALVRRASRAVGEATAVATNLLNPEVIVVGGDIAQAAGHLMIAGVRAVIYERSLPLATQDLEIVLSHLDERAGVIGAALMASTALLAPERIDQLANGSGLRRPIDS